MNVRDSNLLRAMFSAGVMLAFFAVLEGALRLQGEDWSELYQGDPGYDWRLKANLDLPAVPHLEEGHTFSVRTNPDGLRDDPPIDQAGYSARLLDHIRLGCAA